MDSVKLLDAVTRLDERDLGVDSLTILRNGHLVLDAAWFPYTTDIPHQLYSGTKSVTSILTGIAMDQGFIEGLDQPIVDLFPGYLIENLDENKQAITVSNLLTMSSGLRCIDGGTRVFEAMHNAENTIQPILDQPATVPGIGFVYCNLNSHLLMGAVQEATGRPALDYANEMLLGPLGITDYRWQTDTSGVPLGHAGLYLTPHDAARIGYLFLQNGEWNGQRIISPEWVATTTCADPALCPFFSSPGYGFHWWMLGEGGYAALGMAGQFIAVFPEQELVAVALTNGRTGDAAIEQLWNWLTTDLLDAVVTTEPMAANSEAVAALDAKIWALANPAPQSGPVVPEGVMTLNGVEYAFEEPFSLWPESAVLTEERFGYPMDVDNFTLTFTAPDHATLDFSFTDGYTVSLEIGLDTVPRINDTRFGPVAARASMLPNNHVGIATELDYIGQAGDLALILRPTEDGVRVTLADVTMGSTEVQLAQPAHAS